MRHGTERRREEKKRDAKRDASMMKALTVLFQIRKAHSFIKNEIGDLRIKDAKRKMHQ